VRESLGDLSYAYGKVLSVIVVVLLLIIIIILVGLCDPLQRSGSFASFVRYGRILAIDKAAIVVPFLVLTIELLFDQDTYFADSQVLDLVNGAVEKADCRCRRSETRQLCELVVEY
jgi:hypothetical protein